MEQDTRASRAWKALGGSEADSHALVADGRRWVTVAGSGVVSGLASIQVAVLTGNPSVSSLIRSLLADRRTQGRQDLRDVGLFCHDRVLCL